MLMNDMIAYAEVNEILELLEDNYREKVPKELRDLFKEEAIKDYESHIDVKKPLIEQNLRRETIVILAILNLNYWCETEEEKKEFKKELVKNEKEKEELMEKYNSDNLFKNKKPKQENEQESNSKIIEYKNQNFIQKLLNKIKSLLKKEK